MQFQRTVADVIGQPGNELLIHAGMDVAEGLGYLWPRLRGLTQVLPP
jgi:hypothetical protein